MDATNHRIARRFIFLDIDGVLNSFDFRGRRGAEIQDWLDSSAPDLDLNVDRIVILDDDSDMGDLCKYLIKTTIQHGLTQREAAAAIVALFNEGGT